jgi:hypothetical protein
MSEFEDEDSWGEFTTNNNNNNIITINNNNSINQDNNNISPIQSLSNELKDDNNNTIAQDSVNDNLNNIDDNDTFDSFEDASFTDFTSNNNNINKDNNNPDKSIEIEKLDIASRGDVLSPESPIHNNPNNDHHSTDINKNIDNNDKSNDINENNSMHNTVNNLFILSPTSYAASIPLPNSPLDSSITNHDSFNLNHTNPNNNPDILSPTQIPLPLSPVNTNSDQDMVPDPDLLEFSSSNFEVNKTNNIEIVKNSSPNTFVESIQDNNNDSNTNEEDLDDWGTFTATTNNTLQPDSNTDINNNISNVNNKETIDEGECEWGNFTVNSQAKTDSITSNNVDNTINTINNLSFTSQSSQDILVEDLTAISSGDDKLKLNLSSLSTASTTQFQSNLNNIIANIFSLELSLLSSINPNSLPVANSKAFNYLQFNNSSNACFSCNYNTNINNKFSKSISGLICIYCGKLNNNNAFTQSACGIIINKWKGSNNYVQLFKALNLQPPNNINNQANTNNGINSTTNSTANNNLDDHLIKSSMAVDINNDIELFDDNSNNNPNNNNNQNSHNNSIDNSNIGTETTSGTISNKNANVTTHNSDFWSVLGMQDKTNDPNNVTANNNGLSLKQIVNNLPNIDFMLASQLILQK